MRFFKKITLLLAITFCSLYCFSQGNYTVHLKKGDSTDVYNRIFFDKDLNSYYLVNKTTEKKILPNETSELIFKYQYKKKNTTVIGMPKMDKWLFPAETKGKISIYSCRGDALSLSTFGCQYFQKQGDSTLYKLGGKGGFKNLLAAVADNEKAYTLMYKANTTLYNSKFLYWMAGGFAITSGILFTTETPQVFSTKTHNDNNTLIVETTKYQPYAITFLSSACITGLIGYLIENSAYNKKDKAIIRYNVN